jgi:hypothetical protein
MTKVLVPLDEPLSIPASVHTRDVKRTKSETTRECRQGWNSHPRTQRFLSRATEAKSLAMLLPAAHLYSIANLAVKRGPI